MSAIGLVHVVRDGKEMGRYFLSFVELCLGNGDVGEGDWGWLEGMDEWTMLPVLADELRVKAGIKKLTTVKQKKLLNERGFTPWRGMARDEADAILAAVENGEEVATDHWVPKAEITLAQKAHSEFLEVKEFPDAWEEAQRLISSLDSSEGGGPDGHWRDHIMKPTIAQVKECLEELEKEHLQWEDGFATPLYQKLIRKFPALRK